MDASVEENRWPDRLGVRLEHVLVRTRLRRLIDHVRIAMQLADLRSVARLVRMRVNRFLPESRRLPDEPLELRSRHLGGGSVYVRPGATEVQMILYDYVQGFHLPPAEIDSPDLEAVVELGCNAGLALVSYATLYERASILGVEADPANADMARRNVRRFGERCTVVTAAVWDEEADLVIDGPDEYSMAARPAREGDDPSLFRMHGTTVDALLDEWRPEGLIDFMNLSLEGAELRAFSGEPRWPQRVRSVRVEVQPERGFGNDAALAAVSGLGYAASLHRLELGHYVFGVRPS